MTNKKFQGHLKLSEKPLSCYDESDGAGFEKPDGRNMALADKWTSEDFFNNVERNSGAGTLNDSEGQYTSKLKLS